MYPKLKEKILSLKVLAQKGFKNHILEEWICISKNDLCQSHVRWRTIQSEDEGCTFTREHTGHSQRYNTATDLYTWHWRLGHLGDSMLKKLVRNSSVKGMEVTTLTSQGSVETASWEKWMKNHSRT